GCYCIFKHMLYTQILMESKQRDLRSAGEYDPTSKPGTDSPLPQVLDAEVEHVEGEGYGVVLYNDDVHSIDEVIRQVMLAANCSLPVAEAVVMKAHNVGWAVVTVTDLEEANRVAGILREIS